MSASTTKCSPPPTQSPFTAHSTGFQTRFWYGDQCTASASGRSAKTVSSPPSSEPTSKPVQKCFSPAGRHDGDAHRRVVAHVAPDRAHDRLHRGRQRVAALGAIERDRRDAVALLVAQAGERSREIEIRHARRRRSQQQRGERGPRRSRLRDGRREEAVLVSRDLAHAGDLSARVDRRRVHERHAELRGVAQGVEIAHAVGGGPDHRVLPRRGVRESPTTVPRSLIAFAMLRVPPLSTPSDSGCAGASPRRREGRTRGGAARADRDARAVDSVGARVVVASGKAEQLRRSPPASLQRNAPLVRKVFVNVPTTWPASLMPRAAPPRADRGAEGVVYGSRPPTRTQRRSRAGTRSCSTSPPLRPRC